MHRISVIILFFAMAGSVATSTVRAQPLNDTVRSDIAATDMSRASNATASHNRPRIGLALGGGGSRGSAHVGVLKVLQEEHIPIDMIAGTSIGSVVGGYYAAGMPVDDIAKLFQKNTFTKEFAPMPLLRLALEPTSLMLRLFGYRPYDGLYRGWKFRGYVHKHIGFKKIEQLSMPYAAVVTDVVTGKSCRLTTGDLAWAMQASTAVPALKKPVQIGNQLFCDGGLINNIPVNHVREMGADFVIAVDIDELLKDDPLEKFRAIGSMARQALRIQLATFDAPSCKQADFCIHPDTTGIHLVSFDKRDAQRGMDAGIAAARAAMPELKRKLAALGLMPAVQHSSQH